MKKNNVLLKILALTLAFTLVFSCVGISALAEDGAWASPDHTPVVVEGDVEGIASAWAEGDTTVSLEVQGNVANEGEWCAVSSIAFEGGTTTVETGDVSFKWVPSDDSPVEQSGAPAVEVNNNDGGESKNTVIVGDVTSDSIGVSAQNTGGEISATIGDVKAEQIGVTAGSTYMWEKKETTVDKAEFDAFVEKNGGARDCEGESGELWYYDFRDPSIGYIDRWYTENEETKHEYTSFTENSLLPDAGSTTVQVNGNVTVDGDDYDTRGIEVGNVSEKQKTEVTVAGDVTVKTTSEGYTQGVNIYSDAGEATAGIEGAITVTGEGEYNGTTGILASANHDESAVATVIVKNGIVVNAGTKEGARANGISADASDGGTVDVEVTGDVKVSGFDASGINVYANREGTIEISVEGSVIAEGKEGTEGIYTSNYGGTIDVTVDGDVSSANNGLVLFDESFDSRKYLDSEDYPTLNEDELVEVINGGNGTDYLYCHKEGDKEIFYGAQGGNVLYAYTEEKINHDPGKTRVEVIGGVTAKEAGVFVDLTNDKSKIDVIVEGTVKGDTQSVLVSEDTTGDGLTLTVWEIKPNSDGNLVERVKEIKQQEDGTWKQVTESAADIEKKIQYIIHIEPTQTSYITTQGTTAYEGYNVAKEGDTVTLKVNVPDGYTLANAFNGTDTKVELVKDAAGNYYLIVPRGGAVTLSVEFAKIPTKASTGVADTTTKVAVMKEATDTAETTALKELIEEAVKNGDVLSILPDDIKAQIPEGVKELVETITLTLDNYDSKMGEVTVSVQPQKGKYGKDDTATVVIGLPDGKGGYIWFVIKGEGQEDGTLSLKIPANMAAQLAGKTFVTMILK